VKARTVLEIRGGRHACGVTGALRGGLHGVLEEIVGRNVA